MRPLVERLPQAVKRIEEVNRDFTFGKPDESDFIRAILEEFDFVDVPEELIRPLSYVIYDDHGQIICSPAILATVVYEHIRQDVERIEREKAA